MAGTNGSAPVFSEVSHMSSTGMHASDPRIMAQSVEGRTSLLEKALTVDVAESVSRAYQTARCHPHPRTGSRPCARWAGRSRSGSASWVRTPTTDRDRLTGCPFPCPAVWPSRHPSGTSSRRWPGIAGGRLPCTGTSGLGRRKGFSCSMTFCPSKRDRRPPMPVSVGSL